MIVCLQWSDQGVLMLNAALTVRIHEANSHAKKGWHDFTTAAIKTLSAKRRGIVFLLWGKNAQAVEPLIAVDRHHILKSVHPSGLSAARVSRPTSKGWALLFGRVPVSRLSETASCRPQAGTM